MTTYSAGKSACIVLLIFVAALAGCTKNTAPLPPLTADQIPAELNKAYAKAKPEYKAAVEQVIIGLQQKDYSAAYAAILTLFNAPEATKQQRQVAARATLTLNQLLAEAQAQGDAKAAATIQYIKKYK